MPVRKAEVTKPEIAAPGKLDPERLRRVRPQAEPQSPEPAVLPVSAGPVDKIIDLILNASREKLREVTIIDRLQGRLLPLLDVNNALFQRCIEISTWRENSARYKELFHRDRPLPLDAVDDLIHRIAQWQKSVLGKNMEQAMNLALAETESKADDLEDADVRRGFDE